MFTQVFTISILMAGIVQTDGHGRLVNPPGRSTMWRYGFQTPVNTNDHQLSCGGFGVQYYTNGGKCGICGDPYSGPRPNEAGGTYATGTIAKTYKQASAVKVGVEITVNHGGWFEFRLCPNNDPEKRATEECLDKYLLPDVHGVTRHSFPTGRGVMEFTLQLPKDLVCTQCVFQWKYNTASNVHCEGSTCCRGCGPQEQFYGCADVAITPDKTGNTEHKPDQTEHKPENTENKPGISGITPGFYIPPVEATKMPAPGWPFNGNNGNNGNHGNGGFLIPTLPEGLLQVPVDKINDADCKARAFWKKVNVKADFWCRERCASGPCPLDYCEKSCLEM